MFEISVEISFTANHFLRLPGGKVEAPHQHDWRLRVKLAAAELDEYGLIMDFYQLKRLLRQVVRPLGGLDAVNQLDYFRELNASTENLARYLYEQIIPLLPAPIRLRKVTLWETADCSASFSIS